MSLAPCCTPIAQIAPSPIAEGSLTPSHSDALGVLELVQESWLLVFAIHDWHGIEMHPPVQNCRVDAPEIHVRVEITLHQFARIERWHVAVVSALDLLAKHKSNAG